MGDGFEGSSQGMGGVVVVEPARWPIPIRLRAGRRVPEIPWSAASGESLWAMSSGL
jgi:hypothetical protein